MNRSELEAFLVETYRADSDFPWKRYPGYEVFRHPGSRKWFALMLEVPREKLGLPGRGSLPVLNVKCDPLMVGSLRAEPGFFPAYHMNKDNWITAALDGSVPDDKLKALLELSFHLTAPRRGRSGRTDGR